MSVHYQNDGSVTADASRKTWACNCVGPRPGEPLCPCQMVNVFKRDGRWILRERDLGPAGAA